MNKIKTKFRAFDPIGKKMNFGTNDRSEYNSKEKIYSLETLFRLIFGNHLNTLEFDQFTGLVDKDNREIYENDILHCHSRNETFIICFMEGSYIAKDKDSDFYDYLFDFYPHLNCTVLGSTHENPELLKD